MSSRNVSIKVNGELVNFTDVQKVALDRTGESQVAVYNEITDTTATASDVRTGKKFYNKNGVLTTGTYDGGGGSADGWAIPETDINEMYDALIAANINRFYLWDNPDTSLATGFEYGAYYQVYDDSQEV